MFELGTLLYWLHIGAQIATAPIRLARTLLSS